MPVSINPPVSDSLRMPEGVAKKFGVNTGAFYSPADDGSVVVIPKNGESLEKYNAVGTLIWSRTPDDIRSGATGWTHLFCYDPDIDSVWVWVWATGPSFWLASVALSDGTVTYAGQTLGVVNPSMYQRSTDVSVTTILSGTTLSLHTNSADIDLLTTNAAITSESTSESWIEEYITEDGLLTCSKVAVSNGNGEKPFAVVSVAGVTLGEKLIVDIAFTDCAFPVTSDSLAVYPCLWNGSLILYDKLRNSRCVTNRKHFDDWLMKRFKMQGGVLS